MPFISLGAICIVAFLFDSEIGNLLEYDRQTLNEAQIWRFLSAHIAHTNGYHLVLNLAGLMLIWALHGEKYSFVTLLSLFSIIGCIISVGITFFSPELNRYVGLSGLLHGLFIFGACDDIKQGFKTGYLMVVGALIKVVHEQYIGPDLELGEKINAVVAIDAHLYGVIAGFTAFFLYQVWVHNPLLKR